MSWVYFNTRLSEFPKSYSDLLSIIASTQPAVITLNPNSNAERCTSSHSMWYIFPNRDYLMDEKTMKRVFDPFSSGYSINGQAAEILNCGCDGFIQKPFQLNELSYKLREIISK